MAASIESFEATAKSSEIHRALERDGAAIVRRLLPAEKMERLVALLTPELDPLEPGGGEFFGHRKKSVFGLFGRGAEFSRDLLLQPLVLEVADAVLGPNGDHYRVNVGGAIQVWQGGANQPLHREMDIHQPFLKHDPTRPEYILAANWAGSEFSAENGATRIGIGSHAWERRRKAREDEVAQGVMPQGSVLFWLGKTLHGLGANRTETPRTGILFTLQVDWLTQEENQYLAVPPDLARQLPERAQQLLGYRASLSRGWVEGRDSENLLRPAKPGDLTGPEADVAYRHLRAGRKPS
jgi:hypothetical protein